MEWTIPGFGEDSDEKEAEATTDPTMSAAGLFDYGDETGYLNNPYRSEESLQGSSTSLTFSTTTSVTHAAGLLLVV